MTIQQISIFIENRSGAMLTVLETLKEAGITQFAITDRSTALMELLHVLAEEEGCRMVSLCKVTRSEKRLGEEGTEEYEGILMSL